MIGRGVVELRVEGVFKCINILNNVGIKGGQKKNRILYQTKRFMQIKCFWTGI